MLNLEVCYNNDSNLFQRMKTIYFNLTRMLMLMLMIGLYDLFPIDD